MRHPIELRGAAQNAPGILAGFLLCAGVIGGLAEPAENKTSLRFEVRISEGRLNSPSDGRLFVILCQTNTPEPREWLGKTGHEAPIAFAVDVRGMIARSRVNVDQKAFGFPLSEISQMPAGDYFVQALFARSYDIRLPDAPGNLYSVAQKLHIDPRETGTVRLELTEKLPADEMPPDGPQTKFIKIQSKLLSAFHHRPMFLRAGILLPRDYAREAARRYPLWVRIGGFGARCWELNRLMAAESKFRTVWEAPRTPRFIMLQLDGAGPYGDPYYVDSANNGPYGEALIKELIPYVEAQFRAVGEPRARVLSGTSTGGWVSLALQIFYPDFFNGTWSSCPDPVDFRAFELVNIYEGTNAYVNDFGNERPSERALDGDVVLTMRQEVGIENLLGSGNSYVSSGGQWGAWNAVFSRRDSAGKPEWIWNPQTGEINAATAQAWEKYDLRLVLRDHWKILEPKLKGKLHIASGEADQYFLNNAVHLLDEELSKLDPPFSGKIRYGPGKGHGWMDISLSQILEAMGAATGAAP